MNFKKLLVWIISIMLIFSACYATYGFIYKEERMTVSIEKEVENSIPMKELSNRFVIMKWGLFSGAGAGGQGTAQMMTFTAEQFLSQVPEGEKIYSATEIESTGCSCSGSVPNLYRKKYWAFIENRAGLLIYQKEYYYPGFVIESYNENYILFLKENSGNAWLCCFMVFFIVLVVLVVGYADDVFRFKTWVRRADRWNKGY